MIKLFILLLRREIMRKFSINRDTIEHVLNSIIRKRIVTITEIHKSMNEILQNSTIDDEQKQSKFLEKQKELNEIIEQDKKRFIDYFNITDTSPKSKFKNITKILKTVMAITTTAIVEDTKDDIRILKIISTIFAPCLNILEKYYNEGHREIIKFIIRMLYDGNFNISEVLRDINLTDKKITINKFLSSNPCDEDKYLTQNMSGFDREIYHAAITMSNHEYQYFTTQGIFDLLTGNKKIESSNNTPDNKNCLHTKVSAHLREKIENSIRLLNTIEVKIYFEYVPYSALLEYKRKVKDDRLENLDVIMHEFMQSFIVQLMNEDDLLHLRSDILYKLAEEHKYEKRILLRNNVVERQRINNKYFSKCFYLNENPPMYQEQMRKKQIIYFDIELLNTPLKNTEEIIVLKCYLLRCIFEAKKFKQEKLKIDFSDIYKYIGKKESDASMKEDEINRINVSLYDTRENCKKLLQFWNKKNVFSSFDVNSKTITVIL